jgi:hypothetical protein
MSCDITFLACHSDASGIDAAIAFAARIPVALFGGTVEVRPMLER